MDVFKAPEAELIDENQRSYRPLKGVLVGLAYTLGLSSIVSGIWGVAAASFLGIDLMATDLENQLAGSHTYMIMDTLINAVIFYLGGRATG